MKTLTALLIVLSLAAAGCAKGGAETHTATPDPQLRSQALIDSGNAAFKVKDFEAAAKRYASAVEVKSDDPAAYYGLGMALSRLGRDDEAREAYARARALLAQAGDSLPAGH